MRPMEMPTTNKPVAGSRCKRGRGREGGEGQRERQRDRETERQSDRETERQRDRDNDRSSRMSSSLRRGYTHSKFKNKRC